MKHNYTIIFDLGCGSAFIMAMNKGIQLAMVTLQARNISHHAKEKAT